MTLSAFFVSFALLHLNGGLGEGTERCAGFGEAGSSNLVQSTTSEIGTSGGGITYSPEAALWLQPLPSLTLLLMSLRIPGFPLFSLRLLFAFSAWQ